MDTGEDDGVLLNLALGLPVEPGLEQEVARSPGLRKRVKALTRQLRQLDAELKQIAGQDRVKNHVQLRGPLRLLLALDRSDMAPAAVDAAGAIAEACGGEVNVFHVREVGPGHRCEDPCESEDVVRWALEQLRARGLAAHGTICVAPPGQIARRISQVAARTHADLIVLGTHGHSRARTSLTGSVTHEALRLASRPVLVVCR